jgi:imidazolonepropionase-like amidohydrolase
VSTGAFTLRVGQVFDGTDAPVLRNASVTIENGRITSVGAASASARLIDAPDATLLPGLIDCHVHLTLSASPRWLEERDEPVPRTAWKAAQAARRTLEAGFTTVRTLGGRQFIEILLRNAIHEGWMTGPRIVAAGYAVCMTGGHGWWIGRQADGPDDIRKAVREQLQAGADVVKFIATGGVMTQGVEPGATQLGLDELRAGVREAANAGKSTAAHAQGSIGIRNAIEAGVDSIEHGVYLDESLVQLMRERGTFLVPTLIAPVGIVRAGTASGVPDWAVEKAQRVSGEHQRSFALAARAGVPIAFGTDAGTPQNPHGENARELELMVANGMTPRQALVAATSVAARLLRIDLDVGTIQPGKVADLLLVQGDPLADVSVLTSGDRLLAVFKDGRQVAGERLDRAVPVGGRPA